MRLVELNATLACHPFFAEVGSAVPYPPFDRVRLLRVEYDAQDQRFDVIARELEKGLKIRFRDTGNTNNDGTRLWREVFPDPFTDGWVTNTRIGTFKIRGIEMDCIDIH